MGTDDASKIKGPSREVTVSSFFVDRTEVTNGDWGRFATATGYKTVAERPVDWVVSEDAGSTGDASSRRLRTDPGVFRCSGNPVRPSIFGTPRRGGRGRRAPIGSSRKAPVRRSSDANGIRSCTSHTRMRSPTRPGRENAFRPKRNGSGRRAEVSSKVDVRLPKTSGFPDANIWRGTFPLPQRPAAGRLRRDRARRFLRSERVGNPRAWPGNAVEVVLGFLPRRHVPHDPGPPRNRRARMRASTPPNRAPSSAWCGVARFLCHKDYCES
jgi:hypothetical protein